MGTSFNSIEQASSKSINVTVGIPTYRRSDALVKLLTQIKSSPVLSNSVKVIVINDSGSKEQEEQYAYLLEQCSIGDSFDFKYFINSENRISKNLSAAFR